jgi:hypothetical protein
MLIKLLTGIISIINLYIGGRNFLNVIHVLDDTKYSPLTTLLFAILFIGMGLGSIYFIF